MSQVSQGDYATHSNSDTLGNSDAYSNSATHGNSDMLGNSDTRNASKTHLVITGHFIIKLDIANL